MSKTNEQVTFVLYRSRCLNSAYDVTDIDIMRTSIANNAAYEITGFLHREAGYYIQYFEGPAQSTSQLHKLLLRDKRHFDFQLLREGQTAKRLFSGWSMGYSNDTHCKNGSLQPKACPEDGDPDHLTAFLTRAYSTQIGIEPR